MYGHYFNFYLFILTCLFASEIVSFQPFKMNDDPLRKRVGFLPREERKGFIPHLKRVVQSVHRHRVDGADHLQHAVEVVELLEHLQHLDDARQHGHPLVQVHRLDDAPAPHKPDARRQLQLTERGLANWTLKSPWEGRGRSGLSPRGTHFSNHSVRLVVWRIIRSRLGELFSLSSLVQTLPTSSDGRTALRRGLKVIGYILHSTSLLVETPTT